MGEKSSGEQPGKKGKRTYHASIGTSPQNIHLSVHEMQQIRTSAFAVALIKVRRFLHGNAEYVQTGTGWLIAPGLLLTCWHVVATLLDADETPPNEADLQRQLEDMLVFFNEIENIGESIDYSIEKLEFKSTLEQDFAILRLKNREDHPYERFLYLPIESDPPLNTQVQLVIIQHPWGEPQQVAVGDFIGYTDLYGRIRYSADTQPGTSGAPVLRRHNRHVIALHHGKIEDEAVHGEGTRIRTILDVLQLQAPTLYQEIKHAQDEMKAILRGEAPRKDVAGMGHARHTTDNAGTSAPSSKERYRSIASALDKRLQYFYAKKHRNTAPILCMAFDPGGQEILYGAQTDGIHRLDAATLEAQSIHKTCTKAVTSLVVSPDGTYVASGGDDGTLVLWHMEQFTRYKTLQAHEDWVSCTVFSAKGHYLLSGSDDGSLRILDVGSRSSQILKKPAGILSLASHPQKDLIASCSLGHQSIVWPITPDGNADLFELTQPANCLCFSPTGRYLVSGDAEGTLVIYDTQNWSATSLHTEHEKAVHCLAFHPSDTFIVSAGDDQFIQLYDITNGQRRKLMTGHTDRITNLAFSPDGHLLASAGRDGHLFTYKAE